MATKRKAVQVGAGMVGRVIVKDMIEDFDFTVLDMNENALSEVKRQFPEVETVQGRADDIELLDRLSKDADIVTSAMPGTIGYKVIENTMRLGRKIASVSSMHGRDDAPYSKIGKETGGLGIMMIGFAPGMTNFFAGRGYHQLDSCDQMDVYVGGIPYNPRPPFNYTITWSVSDLFNQFVQPAVVVENGEVVERPALSVVKPFRIEEYPEMEAFVSNGLGSLFRNFKDVKNMAEYTVRWPGLTEQMKLMVALDLFDWEPRKLAGCEIVPRQLLFDLFAPKYKMQTGDRDLSVARVVTRGFKGDDEVTYTYEIADVMREERGCTSMAWVTACTCGIFARAMCDGLISGTGMVAAELLAKDDAIYRYVMEEQARRGIFYKEKVEIKKDAKRNWEKN
jgi:saccharopine dehydrogenase-like NADP-dependent oxidoreductase